MTHNMNLNPEPFKLICSGEKTIELRLNDEKRQAVNTGDTIIFSNTQNSQQQIIAVVKNLHRFDSFSALYKNLPLLECGYTKSNINYAKPEDMELYYSKELQDKYGVLGIEISVECIVDCCSDDDGEYICDRLVEYNLSQVPATQEIHFENINKKLVDKDGNIIAGCIARMYCWHVMYIDILWVDEKYRSKGLGSKLLKAVEKTVKEKGCYLVHLDTFDFQAKEFYLKQGYEVFGALKDCPKNHCRYYLQKKLINDTEEKHS